MFAEVTMQVKKVNDIIMKNMKKENTDDLVTQDTSIKRHLCVTKNWFIRVSWTNKKRFLFVLIGDVKCIWTFSLLLKSIWNCRPKDAVMSVCEQRIWSSYDQVPMDNNRTALPLSTLTEVMTSERIWFQSLEPEEQALVLTELVTMSGGPIMWEVLKQAQLIYEKHLDEQLQNLQECEVVFEPPPEKKPISEPVKKDITPRRKSSAFQGSDSAKSGPGQAQKELETNLLLWASSVKSLKDSMKLEEFEVACKDGTRKRIWKVNRQKPEVIETVDIIQLLPSSISKRIFMYIPPNHFGDCARVNKYWAFLIDEIKAEMVARQKIDIELDKLRDIVMRHDVDLNLINESKTSIISLSSKQITKLNKLTNNLGNYKSRALSLGIARRKPRKQPGDFKPIRNMADCTERLEVRGAADDNMWTWCLKNLKINKKSSHTEENGRNEGLLTLGDKKFPCPLMSKNLKIASKRTLDPSFNVRVQSIETVIKPEELEARQKEGPQRYSLWSKHFSNLYPVCKVLSYQSPFQ